MKLPLHGEVRGQSAKLHLVEGVQDVMRPSDSGFMKDEMTETK